MAFDVGRVAGAMLVLVQGALAGEAVLPTVEVVAPTPLPGIGIPRDRIPSNVQVIGPADLAADRGAMLLDRFESHLSSVHRNDVQGNPFQPDVSFRGFTASPLLGTPQGLSVYQDGVRINEPFGDVVNWDLIPQAAIESITLVPGSNPLYGLNTLGGALAVRTRSGLRDPGGTVELSGGAFGRRSGEFGYGQRLGRDSGLFIAGSGFVEDGWRDRSPSDVRQFFAKAETRTQHASLGFTLTRANTDLTGNGLVPSSMFDRRRAAIFTHPDRTRNRLTMFTVDGTFALSEHAVLSAVAYHRRLSTRTLNGDINDAFEDGPDDVAAGGTGRDAGTAVHNRTATTQRTSGATVQWSLSLAAHELSVGFGHDASRSRFEQTSQLGVFDATRGVLETDPPALENALAGRTRTDSVFATDTMRLAENLHLTVSGRYNQTRVVLNDAGPSSPALDGSHHYRRFNPAAGLALRVSPQLTLYGNVSQGSRAPSPIELGCADPTRPCTLPNALAADPPLNQVIAQTREIGARGRLPGHTRWHAGLFDTVSKDDILFVGTTTSAGYFTNFGKTRRRGAEIGLSGRAGQLEWRADYAHVRATFASGACIVSENNSSRGTSTDCSPADPANPGGVVGDDLIAVRPGNRLPNVPDHSVRLAVAWRASDTWRVGAEVVAFSSQFVRGNENNAHSAGVATDLNGDTRTFLGSGRSAGYAVVHLNARYRPARDWELFARVANLFDRRYTTAGALAENPFSAAGTFITDSDQWTRETFLAPGAPRAAWIGVRHRFGGQGRH